MIDRFLFRRARRGRGARAAAPALAAILLSGCATIEPGLQGADLAIPDRFHADAATAAAPREDMTAWWTRLDDPVLTSLVERAYADNLDIAAARARLRQARESEVQARAGRLPSLDAQGSLTRNFDSEGSTSTGLSLGADAAYEVDLFGGVAASVAAAQASADATRYDLASVQVSLAAEVARAYVEARQAQEEVTTAAQLIQFAQDNLQLARWRNQAGLVSSLDVEQARGEAAEAEAALPTYRADFATAVHRLGVLLGLAPGALYDELGTVAPIPAAPANIATGIPLETLRQRPDVISAERTLDAEVARIGVARAELYPSLRLGGSIGGSAASLAGIFDTVVSSVVASIGQMIFDGGQARSQLRSQKAAAQEALASYQQTVLLAFEDVENALVALETARARTTSFREALAAARNQASLTRVSYRSGLVDFSDLLTAERALASAQNGLIQSQANQTFAAIQLYRALGGGWSEETAQEDMTHD